MRIALNAPEGEPTEEQIKFIANEWRNAMKAFPRFARAVKAPLDKWGEELRAATMLVLTGRTKSATPDTKADPRFPLFPDTPLADLMLDDLPIIGKHILELAPNDEIKEMLVEAAGESYAYIAGETFDNVESVFGVAIKDRDEASEEVVRQGGRRMGLVDLDKDTKQGLFDILTEMREKGAGPLEVARAIRDKIPAGPWKTARTRAMVIARTETLHAQRVAQVTAYKAQGEVERMLVFDDRIGFGDEVCSALNGKVVTLEEADILIRDEHPNGTRSFAPIFSYDD